MSFSEREASLATGKPIRLYEFMRGVMRWPYNTSDRDITVGTQVYRSLRGGISDNGLRQSGVSKQDVFVITAPADIEVAQPFRSGARPTAEIGLRVYDMHYGDSGLRHRLTATIQNVRWPTLDSCTITCQDIESSMERPGLTDTYSRTCTTVLFSTKCKVNRDLYRVDTTIQSLSGWTISSGALAAYPDGWFSAGYVEWPIGSGEYERRHIETHVGGALQLLGGIDGLSLNQTIRVYPGCDFLASTCASKFDNLPNLRATPQMDGKSPFDGDQVF